jgi:long-chain acyl-CoA synthetase
MRRRVLPVLLVLIFALRPATAATLEGITLPDAWPVDGHQLVLNGIGLRTVTIFHVRIYVAGLYLLHRSQDSEQILASPDPKAIVLQFLHAGSKAQVEHEYREGEANNCGHDECDPSDAADFERLVAAAPAVEPGDISAYVFTERGVAVYANGRMLVEFANKDLARRLLAGFIGSHPPSAALKRQLLGLPED